MIQSALARLIGSSAM